MAVSEPERTFEPGELCRYQGPHGWAVGRVERVVTRGKHRNWYVVVPVTGRGRFESIGRDLRKMDEWSTPPETSKPASRAR